MQGKFKVVSSATCGILKLIKFSKVYMSSDLHERLKYIDSLLYWRKPFSSINLQQQFSITRQTVKRDLNEYASRFPENKPVIDVVSRQKLYRQPSSFKPQLAEIDFSRFLLQTLACSTNFLASPKLGRKLQQTIMGPLLHAIENRLRFESRYYSVSSGDSEQRVIQPHSIAEACGRFHVRAWCEKNQRYSDFVLARFNEYAELLGPAEAERGIEYDSSWNNLLQVVVIPDPRLNSNRRQAVEMEYAMLDGRLEIASRAALLNYFLKDLRIDRFQENPSAQQIILEPECRELLSPYLWA